MKKNVHYSLIFVQQLERARHGGAEEAEEICPAGDVGVQLTAVLGLAGGHEAALL